MNNVVKVIKILEKDYSKTFFLAKENTSPYYVLISCMLSHRTKDEVTYSAAKRLFKLTDSPQRLLSLSLNKIEKIIYPVGFYKTKAKNIKKVSRLLVKNYHGKVPEKFNELIKLPGVGRKTAGIVLTHAFNKPAMPIDTHCHRIANRLGWVKTKTPEQTELELKKIVPKKYWIELNELLVKHGQNICKPISPLCSKCTIVRHCKKIGVKRFM